MKSTFAALAFAALAAAVPAPSPVPTASPELDERQLGVFPISASGSVVGNLGPIPISVPVDSLKIYPSSVIDVCLGGVCLPEITPPAGLKDHELDERGLVSLSGGQDGTIGLASGSFGPIINPSAIEFCAFGGYDGANSFMSCPLSIPITGLGNILEARATDTPTTPTAAEAQVTSSFTA